MDLVSSAINAVVVGVMGLVLAWLGKGRFDRLERRMDRLEARIDGVEHSLGSRIEAVERSIDTMRSELTHVAPMGALPRTGNS